MKQNKVRIGFSIWMELHKLENGINDMNSEEFQKVIDIAIKKWISYDWLLDFLKHSRNIDVAIKDLEMLKS